MSPHKTVPALLLLALSSCVAVAAAAAAGAAVYGVVKYERNEAYEDYRAGLDTTWQAAVETLAEQGYPVSGDPQHGPTEGKIEAGDARVAVERHAGDFTRVRVRIGTFETEDHKRKARLLLEGIRSKVK